MLFLHYLYQVYKIIRKTRLCQIFARGNAEDAVKRLQMIKNVALKYNKEQNRKL